MVRDLHANKSINDPAFNGIFNFLIISQKKAVLKILPVQLIGIIVIYNFVEYGDLEYLMDFELFLANYWQYLQNPILFLHFSHYRHGIILYTSRYIPYTLIDFHTYKISIHFHKFFHTCSYLHFILYTFNF